MRGGGPRCWQQGAGGQSQGAEAGFTELGGITSAWLGACICDGVAAKSSILVSITFIWQIWSFKLSSGSSIVAFDFLAAGFDFLGGIWGTWLTSDTTYDLLNLYRGQGQQQQPLQAKKPHPAQAEKPFL